MAEATQASGQQSSQSGSEQTSAAGAAQSGGSQATSTTPSRPEGLPDAYWDAEKGVAFDKLIPELTNLTAFKAAEDSRRAAVPEKPDAYKLALPQDHKLPPGVDKFEFDANDPRLPKLREWAHQRGLDQGSMSELLALHADYEIGQQQMLQNARKEQVDKLGANGPARVTALKTWLQAQLGDQPGAELFDRFVLASDIETMENLMRKFSSQGVNGFSQQHREHGARPPATVEQRWYGNGQRKAS